MLSIDEAIAHAREVANTQRGKSGICLQNGLECEHFSDCLKCAEEHEQLAEWLEELKAYKAIGTIEELEALKEEVEPKKVIDKKYNLSTSTDLDKLLGQKPDYERYPGCGYDRSWCG